MRVRQIKILSVILGFVVMIGLWVFLAPTRLGGSTTYSITSGISMQPLLHKNDLALVRAQSSYKVGDAVLYQSQVLHAPVLHRIVLIQNGNYFFKGDNNNFVDPGYATRDELTGKLWLHIPHAGALLGWLGKPVHSAVIAGLTTIIIIATGFTTTQRHRRKHTGPLPHTNIPEDMPIKQVPVGIVSSAVISSSESLPPKQVSSYLEGPTWSLMALVTLLLLGLLLLGIGFSRPRQHEAPLSNAYQQTGSFTYSALVNQPNDVYPSGRVMTGQPIYPSLVDAVTINYKYRFTSKLPHDVKGTIELRGLVLSQTDTWQELAVIKPLTTFTGDTTSLSSTVLLDDLSNLIKNVTAQSGALAANYEADIQPIVHVTGTVNGHRIDETFSPALPFTIGQSAITLNDAVTPPLPGATYTTPSADTARSSTLNPSKTGSILHLTDNTITVAKYKIAVPLIRLLGLIACMLALLLGLIHDTLRRHRKVKTPDELIASQLQSHMVPVTALNVPAGVTPIEIADFSQLAELAQYLERPILYEVTDGHRTYMVDDETDHYITYASSAPAAVYTKSPAKQASRAFNMAHVSWRKLIIHGVIGLVVLAAIATIATSLTASINVPTSKVGRSVNSRAIAQLEPVGCNSLALTSVIVVGATYTSSLSNALILGTSTANTITSNGAGNCIVAGGGADKVTAPASNTCIKGPTTGSTYGNCTLKLL